MLIPRMVIPLAEQLKINSLNQRAMPFPSFAENEPVLLTDSLDEALLVTQLTLLHDRVRKYFGEIDIPGGLAPINSAPAMVFQTSMLVPLNLPGE